jgi:polysaccharide biosynthesis/export protein
MIRRILWCVLIASLVAGCAMSPLDPRLKTSSLETYRLDSGDKLRVTVFGQPDLSGEFNVDSSGLVALPLIEPVWARGETAEEFARSLERVLGQRLLRNPAVSVEITQYRPFFILGEVNRPGQYPYVNGMTVKTAAAIAGGFTYRARTSEVIISRGQGKNRIEGAAPLDTLLLPGDTVTVNERYF